MRSSTFHGQLVYTNQPSNFTDSSPRHLQNNKALPCKRERWRHKALTYLKVSICVWEAMGKVDCVMVMLQLHSPSQRIERLVRFRGRIPVQKIRQTFQKVYLHFIAFWTTFFKLQVNKAKERILCILILPVNFRFFFLSGEQSISTVSIKALWHKATKY